MFDVGSVDGSTRWRVLVTGPLPQDETVVIAVPMNDVRSSLERAW